MAIPTGYHFSTCRLLGHAWHEVPSDWKPAMGTVPMTVRCERCDMERRDSVGKFNGLVESRRYTMPVGYRIPKDGDTSAPQRLDFRMAWLAREVDKLNKRRRGR